MQDVVSISTQADTVTNQGGFRLVRVARKADFPQIINVAQRSFVEDPLFNYFADVKTIMQLDEDTPSWRNLRQFVTSILNLCWNSGGRVTVAVEQTLDGQGQVESEKILAVSLWMLPRKHLSLWKVHTLIKSGFLGMLRIWGLKGLYRVAVEYMDGTESSYKKAFRAKRIKTSVDNSWFLQLAATDPDYQGQGLLSLLVREGFAHGGPNEIFLLEATTAKSRDRYATLGYELLEPVSIGKGKANAQGLPQARKDAEGVEIYTMARWAKPKLQDA